MESKAGAPAGIADTETFGEDLRRATQQVMVLAPIHCRDCRTYHMLNAIERYAGTVGEMPDRSELVDSIGSLIATCATRRHDEIDILIAGAADAGVLAVSAHAAQRDAPQAMERVRFTVLDRCRTPLELCRDYAVSNRIRLDLAATDVAETEETFRADVIVHHGLLNFMPAAFHRRVLAKLASWLKSGGRIVFSTELRAPADRSRYLARRAERAAAIRAAVEAGILIVPEPMDVFDARVREKAEGRPNAGRSNFTSPEEVRALFAASRLRTLSFDHLHVDRTMRDGQVFRRQRVLAVLAAE